jgi:hypothetical protein
LELYLLNRIKKSAEQVANHARGPLIIVGEIRGD